MTERRTVRPQTARKPTYHRRRDQVARGSAPRLQLDACDGRLVALAAILFLAGPNLGWLHWIWWLLIVAIAGVGIARTVIRARRGLQAPKELSAERRWTPRAQVWVISGYVVLIAIAVATGVATHSVWWGIGVAVALAALALVVAAPIAMFLSGRHDRCNGSQGGPS